MVTCSIISTIGSVPLWSQSRYGPQTNKVLVHTGSLAFEWVYTEQHSGWFWICKTRSTGLLLDLRNDAVACVFRNTVLILLPTLRTLWSNCYRTATASELIWLRRNVTGGRFSNLYQRAYFACTNLANHRRCTKLLAHWQWRGRSRCGLGLLQNTQSFWSQLAHTAAYRVCWAIQI